MAGNPNGPERFAVKPTAESHFAWLRTRLSVESTLMSWVRTATALIGFGFTVVQFLDRLDDMSGVKPALRPAAPRYLGLAMILSGILALAISTWQYHHLTGYLRSPPFDVIAGGPGLSKRTPLLAVAVTLLVIGLFAFGAVFFRLR